MFTWSFGWTGVLEPSSPPRSSMDLLEITSFAFMFVDVPEPVWNISTTNWSSNFPPAASVAASTIAVPKFSSRSSSSILV